MTFDDGAIGNISSATKTPDEPILRESSVDPSAAMSTLTTASAEGELSRDAAWRRARVSTGASLSCK